MGRVFLGRSAGGRPVAVKVIRADLAADPEFRVRFAREVAAARRVNGLDGNVVTAPQIANPVTDGNGQITGNFTRDYAQDLSAQLQTGPLPADFRISAIRTFTR